MQIAGKRVTKYSVALLLIVLIGLFLRVYQLGTESIWIDEAYSISISKTSVLQIAAAVATEDANPPFYHFLLHYWMLVFGTSEFAVRLLSTLFGVLAIPMIYVVARQLFNKQVGLVGAIILAVSYINIWYSQEARMYTLMVLLALLSMYFFLRLLQRSTLSSSAGYVLATALLICTHYYGFFVIVAQNVYPCDPLDAFKKPNVPAKVLGSPASDRSGTLFALADLLQNLAEWSGGLGHATYNSLGVGRARTQQSR